MGAESKAMLYECCGDLWSTFVPGAPGIVEQNINPMFGLSNGSNCTFVAISSRGGDEEAAIARASPGEVVYITMPEFVFVHIPFLDTLPDDSDLFQVCGGTRCVPIKVGSNDTTIQTVHLYYSYHPVVLCFASTVHKCQGKTLKRVVICVSRNRGAPKISFEQYFVATTRVRAFADMRRLEMDDDTLEYLKDGLTAAPAFDVFFSGYFRDLQRQYPVQEEEEGGKGKGKKTQRSAPTVEKATATKGARKEAAAPKKKTNTSAVAEEEDDPYTDGNTIEYSAILVALQSEGVHEMTNFMADSTMWEKIADGSIQDQPFHTVLVTRVPYVHFVHAHYEDGKITVTESLRMHVGVENLLGELAPSLSRALGRNVLHEIVQGDIQGSNDCAFFSLNNLLRAVGSPARYTRQSIMDKYVASEWY